MVSLNEFKNCMSRFATGITVAVTNKNNDFVGVTINTFSSLSLNPNLILFNLKKNSFCYDDFVNCNKFAVNILSDTQHEISQLFTQEIDKYGWNAVTLTESKTNFPCFEESLSYLECTKHAIYDGGDHSIVVGKVLKLENMNDGRSPLIYYNREYRKLGE